MHNGESRNIVQINLFYSKNFRKDRGMRDQISNICWIIEKTREFQKGEGETEVAQSCLTLWDPKDCSLPGFYIHGIFQARVLEWVAISFSNAGKWKVKGKSLSSVQLFATPWTAAHQAPPSVWFSRQEYWSRVPLPSPPSLGGSFFSTEPPGKPLKM